MNFHGDFDFLPIRAHFLYGAVPAHPTYGDFALAVTEVESAPDEPAAHWQVEAIRARRITPGVKLDDAMSQINTATAARLYRRAMETA